MLYADQFLIFQSYIVNKRLNSRMTFMHSKECFTDLTVVLRDSKARYCWESCRSQSRDERESANRVWCIRVRSKIRRTHLYSLFIIQSFIHWKVCCTDNESEMRSFSISEDSHDYVTIDRFRRNENLQSLFQKIMRQDETITRWLLISFSLLLDSHLSLALTS